MKKLNKAQKYELFKDRTKGLTLHELARKYHCSHVTARSIIMSIEASLLKDVDLIATTNKKKEFTIPTIFFVITGIFLLFCIGTLIYVIMNPPLPNNFWDID